MATASCLLISGVFETVQAFMPSRSSSAFDLFLNTLGGFAGGLFGRWTYIQR
jgi:VanZ family protein